MMSQEPPITPGRDEHVSPNSYMRGRSSSVKEGRLGDNSDVAMPTSSVFIFFPIIALSTLSILAATFLKFLWVELYQWEKELRDDSASSKLWISSSRNFICSFEKKKQNGTVSSRSMPAPFVIHMHLPRKVGSGRRKALACGVCWPTASSGRPAPALSPALGEEGPGIWTSAGWPGSPAGCSRGARPGSPGLWLPRPPLRLCRWWSLRATSEMTSILQGKV